MDGILILHELSVWLLASVHWGFLLYFFSMYVFKRKSYQTMLE